MSIQSSRLKSDMWVRARGNDVTRQWITVSGNHAFAVYAVPQCLLQFTQWQIAKFISRPVTRKVIRLQRQAPVRTILLSDEGVDMMALV
jgi:hypothetical protein